MTVLPEGTVLGELHMVAVFEYFDGPRLFACRNNSDVRFLAAHADEGDVETWLYVPVSEVRLEALRAGRVDLHTAFADPEDAFAYVVSFRGTSVEAKAVQANSVPADYLPDQGTLLRLPMSSSPIESAISRVPSVHG